MIYAGKRQVYDAYLGTKKVLRAYLGDTLVYAPKLPVSVTIDGVETTSTVGIGDALSLTLSPASGKQICPWTVVVLMGETDITSTAYNSSDNTISIASVEDVVTITASAVTMSAEYKPVEYIQVTSAASGNALDTGYKPSSDTKLVMDVVIENGNTNMLYGNHYTNSTTTPHYFFMYQVSATTNFSIGYGSHKTGTVSTAAGRIKRGARIKFTCNKGAFSYPNASGGTRSVDYSDDGGTFNPSSTTLKVFGYSATSSNGNAIGKIYRVTMDDVADSNGNIVDVDFVPCNRVSDGVAGLYEINSGTYIQASNYSYPA